jgi:DNA-binding transcriptional LysR family regulator
LHRAVELTEAGRCFASELSGAFLQVNRGVEAVRGVRAQRLRITAEPAFASRWLVPRLGGFSLAHPQIELEVETSDELRTLGRDADLAIRYISVGAARPRGRARRLFSMEGVPVTAGVRPRPTKWRRDDAVRSFRLLHDDNGSAWKSWFATAGLDGFERAQHLYFSDYSLAIAAAERRQGVALGTSAFIANELRAGRLVQLGHTLERAAPRGVRAVAHEAGGAVPGRLDRRRSVEAGGCQRMRSRYRLLAPRIQKSSLRRNSAARSKARTRVFSSSTWNSIEPLAGSERVRIAMPYFA